MPMRVSSRIPGPISSRPHLPQPSRRSSRRARWPATAGRPRRTRAAVGATNNEISQGPSSFERAMTPFRSSLLWTLMAAAAACHGDAVTNSPVIPSAAITFVNAVPDTNKMAFRVVDIVSNAGLFGATFRTGNILPIGIQAGTRHLRVFFDTTDVVLAKTILVDTSYAFAADENYSFIVTGFARAAPLRATIVHDAAPPA